MLFANPKIGLFSFGLKLHLSVDVYLLKNKKHKKVNDKWGNGTKRLVPFNSIIQRPNRSSIKDC